MRVNIFMNCKFGSNFQKEFYLNTLQLMLIALTEQASRSHKKNKIDFSINYSDNSITKALDKIIK